MDIVTNTSRASKELDLIPLINIVFLILIFFMLTGSITATDPLAVEPVQSTNENAAPPENKLITIDKGGQLALEKIRIDREELRRLMIEQKELNTAIGVSIKADASLPASILLDLMKLLRESGFEEVTILTVAGAN